MKAIQIEAYGGPEQLKVAETPDPVPGAGQVLVKIHAATFNAIDSKLTSGAMKAMRPLAFPWIPGADFSGVVAALGAGVTDFAVGDDVYGYAASGGAYAELIAVDAGTIAPKPRTIDYAEAASVALVAQTASQALDAAGLTTGQTILIHGAGGSVGSMAVQLAHLRGARVIGTATGEGTIARLRALGADEVINYKTTPFETVVHGVDAVLDSLGGETQQKSFGVLKPGGVLVALSQPPSLEEAAAHQVRAVMLDTKPLRANLESLTALVDAGQLQTLIGKTYPLAEAATAWREMASQHIEGKVVFTVIA